MWLWELVSSLPGKERMNRTTEIRRSALDPSARAKIKTTIDTPNFRSGGIEVSGVYNTARGGWVGRNLKNLPSGEKLIRLGFWAVLEKVVNI